MLTDFPLEEHGAKRHIDLAANQGAGLAAVAGPLARAIRAGLASGRYVLEDGVVKLAESPTMLTIPADEETEAP